MNNYGLAGMVSLALAGIAQVAPAQDYGTKSGGQETPWYLGAGIGKSWASIPEQTIDGISSTLGPAETPPAAFTVIDKDRTSTGGKLFLGFDFNRYFAVEGGYANLGNSQVHMNFLNGTPVLTSVGTFDMKYKMSAAFIDAVGMLPVNEQWSLIGRVGVSYNKVDADYSGNPLTFITSSNNTTDHVVREKFGAGVDYNFNTAFTVRAEWERYKMPDPFSDELFNVDTATVSLLYHF